MRLHACSGEDVINYPASSEISEIFSSNAAADDDKNEELSVLEACQKGFGSVPSNNKQDSSAVVDEDIFEQMQNGFFFQQ